MMLLSSAISKWHIENEEQWFIQNLERLLSELRIFNDRSKQDECEDLLWQFIDVIDNGKWQEKSQFTLIEYVLDASILLGNRDVFQELVCWRGLDDVSSIKRHVGTKLFLESLDNITTLTSNIPAIKRDFFDARHEEVDERWMSISLIALVDLAQRELPLSPVLPDLLEESFKTTFQECSINWFLPDLGKLDPNQVDWLEERERILRPIYE